MPAHGQHTLARAPSTTAVEQMAGRPSPRSARRWSAGGRGGAGPRCCRCCRTDRAAAMTPETVSSIPSPHSTITPGPFPGERECEYGLGPIVEVRGRRCALGLVEHERADGARPRGVEGARSAAHRVGEVIVELVRSARPLPRVVALGHLAHAGVERVERVERGVEPPRTRASHRARPRTARGRSHCRARRALLTVPTDGS